MAIVIITLFWILCRAFGYLKNAEDEVMMTFLPADDRLL